MPLEPSNPLYAQTFLEIPLDLDDPLSVSEIVLVMPFVKVVLREDLAVSLVFAVDFDTREEELVGLTVEVVQDQALVGSHDVVLHLVFFDFYHGLHS